MKVSNLREAVNFFYGSDYGSMLNSTRSNSKFHDVYLKSSRELLIPFVGQIGHISEDGLVTNFFGKFNALDSSQHKSDKVDELLSIVNKFNEILKSSDAAKTFTTNLDALTGASNELINNMLSIKPDLSGSNDMEANEFLLNLFETHRNKFIKSIENSQKDIAELCLTAKGGVVFNGKTLVFASSNGKYTINFSVKLYCSPNDNSHHPSPLNLNLSFDADSYNDLVKNSNKYVLFAKELIEKVSSSKLGFGFSDISNQLVINREVRKIREELDSDLVDFTLSGGKGNINGSLFAGSGLFARGGLFVRDGLFVRGGLFIKGDYFATIKF